jgi:hypothetical protein
MAPGTPLAHLRLVRPQVARGKSSETRLRSVDTIPIANGRFSSTDFMRSAITPFGKRASSAHSA